MKNECVIYCRVSSKEQEETGYSLPAQEKLLVEYAHRKGFELVKAFTIAINLLSVLMFCSYKSKIFA